jgi:cilia- and flagella-associated protein 57
LAQNKDKRKNIEDEAWDQIDRIKERNKDELASIIDLGIESKGRLTKVTSTYRTKKTQKE